MNPTPAPSEEEARAFAVMIVSGMPSEDAISYFIPEDEPDPLTYSKQLHSKWIKARTVRAAISELQGSWQDLSPEQRWETSLSNHYNQLAYFLYSHNYSSLVGADKQKADTCRQALEAKIAGQAGKVDAMTRFFDDVKSGAVKLAPIPTKPKLN